SSRVVPRRDRTLHCLRVLDRKKESHIDRSGTFQLRRYQELTARRQQGRSAPDTPTVFSVVLRSIHLRPNADRCRRGNKFEPCSFKAGRIILYDRKSGQIQDLETNSAVATRRTRRKAPVVNAGARRSISILNGPGRPNARNSQLPAMTLIDAFR